MRVLLSPRAELHPDGLGAVYAERLTGDEGSVVSLRRMGVGDLSRRLSFAEVALLRTAILGVDPGAPEAPDKRGGVVGYVCEGSCPVGTLLAPRGRRAGEAAVVAVTDHANLTWRSPLVGPNDDRLGPRFPNMTGVYAPEIVTARLDVIMDQGVVAGVLDEGCLTVYEQGAVEAHQAVSSELVPVVIVAAHLGMRVAAAVMIVDTGTKGDGGGRP